ncbi:MAG: glycosyltransferase family 9 protein, partial [Candidatus Eisenbacteria bacterium]
FERAAGYLGCDSGPMHLAAAVGAPVVALFFRSNPYHYAPLGPGNTVVLLADPYGVEDARWNELPDRAQLVRAESAPAESRAGRPRSDDEAVLRIAQAVDSTWRSTGAGPDSTERPRVLQDPRERV